MSHGVTVQLTCPICKEQTDCTITTARPVEQERLIIGIQCACGAQIANRPLRRQRDV